MTNQKDTEWQPGQLGIGEKFLGGGGGHYLCREGHNFFTEQNLGRVTILFLLKLREGHKAWGFFLLQNQLILISVLVNYPPTNNWSFAQIQMEALFGVYLIHYISFLKLYVFQSICNCLESRIYLCSKLGERV